MGITPLSLPKRGITSTTSTPLYERLPEELWFRCLLGNMARTARIGCRSVGVEAFALLAPHDDTFIQRSRAQTRRAILHHRSPAILRHSLPFSAIRHRTDRVCNPVPEVATAMKRCGLRNPRFIVKMRRRSSTHVVGELVPVPVLWIPGRQKVQKLKAAQSHCSNRVFWIGGTSWLINIVLPDAVHGLARDS